MGVTLRPGRLQQPLPQSRTRLQGHLREVRQKTAGGERQFALQQSSFMSLLVLSADQGQRQIQKKTRQALGSESVHSRRRRAQARVPMTSCARTALPKHKQRRHPGHRPMQRRLPVSLLRATSANRRYSSRYPRRRSPGCCTLGSCRQPPHPREDPPDRSGFPAAPQDTILVPSSSAALSE